LEPNRDDVGGELRTVKEKSASYKLGPLEMGQEELYGVLREMMRE
jgi:hypothetical protein